MSRKRLFSVDRYPNGKPKNFASKLTPHDTAAWKGRKLPEQDGLWSVYVMTAEGPGLLKIGFARDPVKRLQEMEKRSPYTIRAMWAVLLESGDARRLEKAVHLSLRGSIYHHRREWYSMSAEVAQEIITRTAKEMGLETQPNYRFGAQPIEPGEQVRFASGPGLSKFSGWHHHRVMYSGPN